MLVALLTVVGLFGVAVHATSPVHVPECPPSHPYAYNDGQHCCETKMEKFDLFGGWKCDGSELFLTSSCCAYDAHTPCPDGICADSSYMYNPENDGYVAYSGQKCHNVYTYRFDLFHGCDGWSGTTLEECVQKCEENSSPNAANCPAPSGGCRYAVYYKNTGWCHLAGNYCEFHNDDQATVVDLKPDTVNDNTPANPGCTEPGDSEGLKYRGDIAVTKGGKRCQRWDDQYPREHSYTPEKYPDAGLDENFCRNPNGDEDIPWCYNGESSGPRWDWCDIPKCEVDVGCHAAEDAARKGSGYRGTQNVTEDDVPCQNWRDSKFYTQEHFANSGIGDHNYCRNPDGGDRNWCYKSYGIVDYWEYCEVPICPAKEVTCPASHPYAYYDGQHCCATKREKFDLFGGWKCDGSELFLTSSCCANDAHTPCPDGGLCGDYVVEAVDGGFGEFGDWSECSATCGGGTQSRSRACDSPAPAHGGADCVGDAVETRACNEDPCAVDGGFGEFSDWSECSAKCEGGTQSRSRACDSPAPANGGADCVGDAVETRACNEDPCAVDGGFGEFSDWTECSAKCEGGTQSRSRACDSPAPANGGADCKGDAVQTRACNEGPCPINGGLGKWTKWSKCDKKCGGGVKTRTRPCNNPKPQYGGKDCSGADAVQTRKCNTKKCPEVKECIRCDNNPKSPCINDFKTCDGIKDCPNGADEKPSMCRGFKCHSKKKKCNDGLQCVAKKSFCNRRVDCNDGSDETGC